MNKRKDFLVCPRSVVAPTQQPATDGHRGSPPSRFLTLNWSSRNVRLETMGESSLGILDHAMRPPGTGQAESRERETEMEREGYRQRKCFCVCVCNSVCKSVCTSYYLRLLSILWGNQMGSIHTTVSSGGSLQPPLVIFCHQSSAIFSFLPPPSSLLPSFSVCLFLPILSVTIWGRQSAQLTFVALFRTFLEPINLKATRKKIMCHFFSLMVSMWFQVKLF